MASKKKRYYPASVDELIVLREAGAHIWWRTVDEDRIEPWLFSVHGLRGDMSSELAAKSAESWLEFTVPRLFLEIA